MAADLHNRSTGIRRATHEDAEQLTAIARSAKVHWGYPESWLDAWRDALTIRPDTISGMHVFLYQIGNEVIGFYALDTTGPDLMLEHFWVSPDHIGQGFGAELFAHAVRQGKGMGTTRIVIESDPNAEGFYHRMGARRIGSVSAPMPDAPDRQLPLLEFRYGNQYGVGREADRSDTNLLPDDF